MRDRALIVRTTIFNSIHQRSKCLGTLLGRDRPGAGIGRPDRRRRAARASRRRGPWVTVRLIPNRGSAGKRPAMVDDLEAGRDRPDEHHVDRLVRRHRPVDGDLRGLDRHRPVEVAARPSRSTVAREKAQPITVASGSGRRAHACPPGAPIHTSGASSSVSAPGPASTSVVRIRSSAPASSRSRSAPLGCDSTTTRTSGSLLGDSRAARAAGGGG